MAKNGQAVLILGVALLAVLGFGLMGGFSGKTGGATLAVVAPQGQGVPATSVSSTTGQVSGSCPITSTSAITYSSYNNQQRGTSVGLTSLLYDAATGTVYSSTASYAPGLNFDLYQHNNTNFYAVKSKLTTQCGGTTVQTWADAVGTATILVRNADDTTNSTPTANQAFGASEAQTVSLRFREATSYANFGNTQVGYNVVTIAYNATDFDTNRIVLSGVPGITAVPVAQHNLRPQSATWETGAVAFKVPKVLGAYEQLDLSLTMVARSGINPTQAAGNVSIKISDGDYYIHTLNSQILDGVEDNTGTDIGATDVTATLYVS